jgi:flagellar biosynthesis/type III secretory pathway protein FliH
VFDSLEKFDKLGAEAQEQEIKGVIARVSPLGDSDEKDYLVATITDSFKNASGALEKKAEVGKILDGLYAKCKEADEKSAKAVVDAILGGSTDAEKEAAEKEKAEKEAKEKAEKEAKEKGAKGGVEDAEKRVEEIVAKALAGVADSVAASVKDGLPALVEKTVKEALGLKEGAAATTDSGSVEDDMGGELDPSFLLDGAFGSN